MKKLPPIYCSWTFIVKHLSSAHEPDYLVLFNGSHLLFYKFDEVGIFFFLFRFLDLAKWGIVWHRLMFSCVSIISSHLILSGHTKEHGRKSFEKCWWPRLSISVWCCNGSVRRLKENSESLILSKDKSFSSAGWYWEDTSRYGCTHEYRRISLQSKRKKNKRRKISKEEKKFVNKKLEKRFYCFIGKTQITWGPKC